MCGRVSAYRFNCNPQPNATGADFAITLTSDKLAFELDRREYRDIIFNAQNLLVLSTTKVFCSHVYLSGSMATGWPIQPTPELPFADESTCWPFRANLQPGPRFARMKVVPQ